MNEDTLETLAVIQSQIKYHHAQHHLYCDFYAKMGASPEDEFCKDTFRTVRSRDLRDDLRSEWIKQLSFHHQKVRELEQERLYLLRGY